MGQWHLNSSSSSSRDSQDPLDLDSWEHDEVEMEGMEVEEDDQEDHDGRSVDIDDADSDAGVADTFSGNCITTCRPKWVTVHEKAQHRKQLLRAANAQIRELQRQNQKQGREIRRLQSQIQALRLGSSRQRTKVVSVSFLSKAVWKSAN